MKVYIFEDLTLQIYTKNNLLSNLLWFYNFIKKMIKRKKEDDTFLRKKAVEKQNSANIIISVDEKGIVFPVKLKLNRG